MAASASCGAAARAGARRRAVRSLDPRAAPVGLVHRADADDGPARTPPAVAFGLAAMILNSSVRRLSPALWLNNLSTYAAFPLAGGLLVGALIGDVHSAADHKLTQG